MATLPRLPMNEVTIIDIKRSKRGIGLTEANYRRYERLICNYAIAHPDDDFVFRISATHEKLQYIFDRQHDDTESWASIARHAVVVQSAIDELAYQELLEAEAKHIENEE